MMRRRFAALPLLALAATSLPGCIAVAIPALAGSAILGARADAVTDGEDTKGTPAPVAAATPESAPVEISAPAAAPVELATATQAVPTELSPPPPPPLAPAPVPEPPPVPVAEIPGAPTIIAAPATQSGFAQFVRYGSAVATAGTGGTAPLSAMLKDPIAIDGQRRRCEAGEQPVAVIDLDSKGGVFTPPASPTQQPGLALGLAVLREAGVVITWLSDLSVNQSGALRTSLEQSGLDPRGEDIISLRRENDDRKQQRKDNLAGITCIIAIAGDQRADFDERFKYLRSLEAGAELEPIIGDGWFLIEPVFPEQPKAEQ